jgi:CAAX prenyl protease-like protein
MQRFQLSADEQAMARHILPFAGWILIMLLPVQPAGTRYALQTLVTGALLLGCRPWRYYAGLRVRLVLPAVALGLAVCAVWVLPEVSLGTLWPWLGDAYQRWGIRPFGIWPKPGIEVSPYAPETAGWWVAAMRLAGSTLAIAPAEEFFWRGFLLRWLSQRHFLAYTFVPRRWLVVILAALVFGLEHHRWAVGWGAGILFSLLYIRTGNIWAAVLAHSIANFALGVYVLVAGAYAFW